MVADPMPDFFKQYRVTYTGPYQGDDMTGSSAPVDTEEEVLGAAKYMQDHYTGNDGRITIEQRRVIAGVPQGWEPYDG